MLVDGDWAYDDSNTSVVVPLVNLSSQFFQYSATVAGDALEHNVVYFATIVMYHRGVSILHFVGSDFLLCFSCHVTHFLCP
jgi:hypothetical protein